jgi:hypothetical protein
LTGNGLGSTESSGNPQEPALRCLPSVLDRRKARVLAREVLPLLRRRAVLCRRELRSFRPRTGGSPWEPLTVERDSRNARRPGNAIQRRGSSRSPWSASDKSSSRLDSRSSNTKTVSISHVPRARGISPCAGGSGEYDRSPRSPEPGRDRDSETPRVPPVVDSRLRKRRRLAAEPETRTLSWLRPAPQTTRC